MSNKIAANTGIVLVLVLVLIVAVAFIYLSPNLSGLIPGSGGPGSGNPGEFSVSPSIQSSSVLAGRSTQMVLTYFNPYSEAINMVAVVNVSQVNSISVSPSKVSLLLPNNMQSVATVAFNTTCLNAPANSNSVFSFIVSGFSQKITTSIVTYPTGTASDLIPNSATGFSSQQLMSFSASPIQIVTGVSQTQQQTSPNTLNILISPNLPVGATTKEPTTSNGFSPSAANNQVSSLTVSLSNKSGQIASAFLQYNGQNLNLVASPADASVLEYTLNDVQLSLLPSSGLALVVTAKNIGGVTSENLINVTADYNYFFSELGPSISCQ